MSSHVQVLVPKLNVEIDEQIVDLVLAFNEIGVVQTISSCQGNPGIIGEGGSYGHICFQDRTNPHSYIALAHVVFAIMWQPFRAEWDDFCASVDAVERGYQAWFRFRNERIGRALEIVNTDPNILHYRSVLTVRGKWERKRQ